MQQVESDLKLAVVGCPYSGTKYMQLVLRSIGLDVGHEVIEKNGTVSWRHTYYGVDDFAKEGIAPEFIFHQVRHPLMTIANLIALGDKPWRYIIKACRSRNFDLKHFSRDSASRERIIAWWTRSMALWVYWNEFAEEVASFSYQIEHFPLTWPKFLSRLGLPVDTPLPYLSTIVNRHKVAPVPNWDFLYNIDAQLTLRVLEMAKKYGYTQVPYFYFRDPYYKFPKKLLLTLDKSPCP